MYIKDKCNYDWLNTGCDHFLDLPELESGGA